MLIKKEILLIFRMTLNLNRINRQNLEIFPDYLIIQDDDMILKMLLENLIRILQVRSY